MRFARVISVLQALDKPSLKKLEDYLHSPYFKIPHGTIHLFNYLKMLPVAYSEEQVSETRIAQKISFLDNRNKQDIVTARLLKAIEHFLVFESLAQDKYNQLQHLLKSYQNLHLFEHFQRTYEEAMKKIEHDPEQDVDTFFYRHIFTELSFNGFNAKLNRTSKNDISPVLKTMDEFYSSKKSRYLKRKTEKVVSKKG